MHVGMVAYTFYESDNRVMRYAETLVARGDQVDVIALRRPSDSCSVCQVNGVHLYGVQTRSYDEKGVRSYAAKIGKFLLRASWLLAALHRRQRYDVIHVHSVPDLLVFAAWLPKLTGTKVILDIHDLLPELYLSKFNRPVGGATHRNLVLVEHACAAVSDHVIVANHLWRDKLIARGSVAPEKCTAILNFPDENIFKRNGYVPDPKKFTIIYPGTLNWHQGLDIALNAFGIIRSAAPLVEFHIYGDGSSRPSLVRLTQELGLQKAVFFHERIPLRHMANTMATADLAVVPKRRDSFGDEAFSTKTLEFMILGVPLIVADTTIDKHYFNDSVVKFFRSGDVASLAASMLELINNPAKRHELADNGLRFAQQYTWQAHFQDYLQIVDSLGGKRP